MAQELKPGAFLRHDTYRIERMLGQGGFGITYLAWDMNLERRVAVKEFFPASFCGRENTTSQVTPGTQGAREIFSRYKGKFLKEARNIAKFDHPGIIKIHAAFEENGTAYYVMDYIEGMSLADMVERQGKMRPEMALGYIRSVAEALDYVHARKINHLDIKPANIMVRRSDNRPILIDFGLSKQYDAEGHQTSTTPTGISHGYAPIEQYTEGGVRQFSPQTDLYSLAATLYFLMSGQAPRQATSLIEEGLRFPQEIPVAMRPIIATAMSPGRQQRQPTVKAFIAELTMKSGDDATRIVDQPKPQPVQPVVQPPVRPAQPKPVQPVMPSAPKSAKAKRFPMVAMVGIGAVVVGAVVTALIVFTPGKSEKKEEQAKDTTATLSTAPIPKDVQDMQWASPLGNAVYTGAVDEDNLPHGSGTANITGGDLAGAVYKGEFNHGKFEGKSVYTLKSGDKFSGTFRNNEYEKGRYTDRRSGVYFEGTFSNGSPDKGIWYNKDGSRM